MLSRVERLWCHLRWLEGRVRERGSRVLRITNVRQTEQGVMVQGVIEDSQGRYISSVVGVDPVEEDFISAAYYKPWIKQARAEGWI